ncbi:hypothetical protein ACIBG4_38320 [Nonomuraea sp. NPDC050383]|uniref:hypothetical protein n=1 Tax=Nonomuraea sp. NPDC050383 TaxID=3364362 RepID=UPI00378D0FCD
MPGAGQVPAGGAAMAPLPQGAAPQHAPQAHGVPGHGGPGHGGQYEPYEQVAEARLAPVVRISG